ncbi:cell surface protein SprA [Solitalea lacus]|uniref:T9SS outer membrane translocon Sov/SprA n=1 Tax=Solitalea lacus TaxID=2911172 RepID=UPI001EDC7FEC|nr:cell surface protein SprA [Solitalea lacus]UKJ08290.1 cell surface protein SprA [Solitalea lacus]
MKPKFTIVFLAGLLFVFLCGCCSNAQGQAISSTTKADTNNLRYPFKERRDVLNRYNSIIGLKDPSNVSRRVEYDPKTNTYEIIETIGGRTYRSPQKLTFEEYKRYTLEEAKRSYWQQKTGQSNEIVQNRGLLPKLTFQSKTFNDLFGGSFIDIRPQGFAEVNLSTRFNKNENPLFNTRQRQQASLDFDERLQLNLTGQIGEKLKINTNFNTQAQFDFENQMKFEYTGKEDEIVRKVEVGNVSMPIAGTLINGSQSLFGIKTQMQFGRLGVTGLFSQQRSEMKEINITNGAQESEFMIQVDNYEANKHYFLATYFRDKYNEALSRPPIVNSGVVINKIEVWVTNRTNNNSDSRDILAFLDLGENKPYNSTLFLSGQALNPSGFNDGVTPQSNNLLTTIPSQLRFTNDNTVNAYFQGTGGSDNYAKLTYARKLNDREYKFDPVLGYISLNQPLNNDEVLAVAYRYTLNGVQYQVGEFSTDVPQDPSKPVVLYVKLLKNELLKTYLPTWDLMMKNIYSLNAYQVSQDGFRLNVIRLDEKSGVEQPVMPEGLNTKGKPYIQLANLDRINNQQNNEPDGVFDFINGVTIDPLNGRIVFPVVEPFGKDLASKFSPTEVDLIRKYVYQPLYDSTRFVAQQFPSLNRYYLKGIYKSSTSSEFNLNAINVPQGSVLLMAGPTQMVEGVDFTVDYNLGRVKILNEALLNSGMPIKIKLESTELFGIQSRTMMGARFDYNVNDKLNLGSTILSLSERPLTQKVNIGDESISNTIYGFDANFRSESKLLTRLVDKLPFISTKEPSSISFNGEFAQFMPGHARALNIAGDKGGVSYLDDFETTRSIIDLKNFNNWFISGTPQLFPEAQFSNDLSYGYNRSLLAFYTIDPIFYSIGNSTTPSNIKNNKEEQSNPYVREVTEQEVFPNKQAVTGTPLLLPTLDVAFYPKKRGPYNYTTTGVLPDGTLSNPQSRWGGMFRKLEQNDFQALNVEYIEFWVMDPFLGNPNSKGGDLYFNLGNISEDILKDGSKSVENALPAGGDPNLVTSTVWGNVGKNQPVTQAFDNDPSARQRQDVGLDGLSSEQESAFFQVYLNQLRSVLPAGSSALEQAEKDPSSDDFVYFRGPALDAQNALILQRYSRFNGTESNSKTSSQAQQIVGIENAASTPNPDGEDINRDNNMSASEEYFQYKVSIRQQDLVIGQNFLNDKVVTNVKLQNGKVQPTTWYQFRIPITAFQSRVGNIQDFRSIRFIRMFMTGFTDSVIMRFAKLQLVRGEWKEFNPDNNPLMVLREQGLPASTTDNSNLNLAAINLEENGNREPIPYVIPPGIEQQQVQGVYRENVRLNEQSLLLRVDNLSDGFSRASYKTINFDFRSYKRLKMFVHAEGGLSSGDVRAIVRLGTDYDQNYYEYEVPLTVTPPGSKNPDVIWPSDNNLDIAFETLQKLKRDRNALNLPINELYTIVEGRYRISIKGQPDLSKTRVLMLGVRNPYQGNNSGFDDGLPKSAELWFDELRIAEFKEEGGMAMTGLMNAKLADFATVSLAGSMSTFGFGSLDRKVSQINRSQNATYDVSSNIELGKFFPKKVNFSIPMYISYARDTKKPEYSPISPDLLLNDVLNSYRGDNRERRDSLASVVNDVTTRRSINFTNVRKNRNPGDKVNFYDFENFNFTFAHTEFRNRSYTVQNNEVRTYKAIIAYNFQKESKNFKPFGKVFKKGWSLIRDLNMNLAPQVIDVQFMLDRYYSENTLRATEESSYFIAPSTYNKSYYLTGIYNVGWDMSSALRFDYSARSLSSVDEPSGAITPQVKDSIQSNLFKFGRPVEFSQRLGLTYNVPLNRIKPLSWTSFNVRYAVDYNWRSEPLSTMKVESERFGNTIQNARTVGFTGQLNFAQLFGKIRFLRDPDPKDFEAGDIYRGFLTMLKNANGTYTLSDGTFLPGYLPQTSVFGSNPGLGFMMGSQKDIRYEVASKGQLTTYASMNSLYMQNRKEDLSYRVIVEPIKDFRIELSGTWGKQMNDQSNFRYDDLTGTFQEFSPVRTGMFTISTIALNTAFETENNIDHISSTFTQFDQSRKVISERLGSANVDNSIGKDAQGYADGYGRTQQDVVVNAFLSAYLRKDANSMSLNAFPSIPLPNWRVTYNGLTKIPFVSELFSSININHSYKSVYTITSFTTLINYAVDANGNVTSRSALSDDNGNFNFLPEYQMGFVTLSEDFLPLLGMDMKFKNNMTANFEFRKSRLLSFSLANTQMSQMKDNQVTFGLGYRTQKFKLPFRVGNLHTTNNDLNFRMDFSLRGNRTIIYQLDNTVAQVAGGTTTLSVRPSVDYVINQRFNFRLYVDRNVTKPETSNTYKTSYTNVGVGLRLTL